MAKGENLIYEGLYGIKKLMFSDFKFISSPIVDTLENNFLFLRMGEHVSLSKKDTFYVSEEKVLRTHASNFQRTVFETYGQEIKESMVSDKTLRFSSIGRVFRKDDSKRHSYFFHQCDGLIIGRNVTFESALLDVKKIIFNYMGRNCPLKIRRSFFPFTRLSSEMDILINGSFLEVMGFGMTHPEILEKCNLSGISCFAFGFGIERLVSIKHKYDSIKEIRKS